MNPTPALIAFLAYGICASSIQAQDPSVVSPVGVAPCDQSWRTAWDINLVAKDKEGIISEIVIRIRNVGNRKLEGTNVILDLYIGDSFEGWLYDEKIRNTKISLMPNEEVVLIYDMAVLVFKPVGDDVKERKYSNRLIKGNTWLIKASLSDTLTEIPSCESSFLVWSNGVRNHDNS